MSYASLNLDTEIYWWNHVVYILTRYFKFVTDLGIYCYCILQWSRSPNCWFARDVTAAMLAVCWWSRTKHFSPLGSKIKFSCKFFEKKFYCIEQQHTTDMASLSRGCNPKHKTTSYPSEVITLDFIGRSQKIAQNKNNKKIHLRLLIKQKYAQDLFISYSSSSLFFFFKRVTLSLQ